MAAIVHEPVTICQAAGRPAEGLVWPLSALARLADAWSARQRSRQAFAQMTERDLRDAALLRWDIERELARPFWRD